MRVHCVFVCVYPDMVVKYNAAYFYEVILDGIDT